MLQRKHSAILWTFIKPLPFVIKIFALSIFDWPLKTGFTVRNMLPVSYHDILCLVEPDLCQNCFRDYQEMTQVVKEIRHGSKFSDATD